MAKKKNKVISVIMFILFILCIFGLIWSGYKIYKWYLNINDNKDYKDYLNEMKNRSIYNYNIKLSDKDKILTLSTCQGYTGNKRLVIHAVRID